MLLPARDHSAHTIWNEGHHTGRGCVIRADFERHCDRHFATRAFYDAHKAMAGAIFACPGVIVQFAELPGAQRLNWHKISEDQLTGSA